MENGICDRLNSEKCFMDKTTKLIVRISETGKSNRKDICLPRFDLISHYFLTGGKLNYDDLDKWDGCCTRRELLARLLLLYSFIMQFDDISPEVFIEAINQLYLREIRFLHRPAEFFASQGMVSDLILEDHRNYRGLRPFDWRKTKRHSKNFIDKSSKALDHAINSWVEPLALIMLLERDCQKHNKMSTALIDYLEFWQSSGQMCTQLQRHPRYGLGKAIGDKACHLFAKWVVSSFRLTRRTDPSWSDFSFEVPYDSNAGRVLWRTGYLLKWASKKDYIKREVIQERAGKQGLDYIRVTNIRGMGATNSLPPDIQERYINIALNHLKSHVKVPSKVEIQRIQHAYLLDQFDETGYGVADFDEGLIYIGTTFCFNHNEPKCDECPLVNLCEGHSSNQKLISNYRT